MGIQLKKTAERIVILVVLFLILGKIYRTEREQQQLI
jgi:hypothetical protein